MQRSFVSGRKLVHVERIAIRWGDMDAMGHVNNTVYFRYMEQARIGWFDALVPEETAWKSTGIVIANASCNFKRPINYPGTVEVKVYARAPGGSSVGTFYELRVDEDQQIYAVTPTRQGSSGGPAGKRCGPMSPCSAGRPVRSASLKYGR